MVILSVIHQRVLVRLIAGLAFGTWLIFVFVPILAQVLVAGFGPATLVRGYCGPTV